MTDVFLRFCIRNGLDMQAANCNCCTYLDKHTERAWLMWQPIWSAIHEGRAPGMGRGSDTDNSVAGGDDAGRYGAWKKIMSRDQIELAVFWAIYWAAIGMMAGLAYKYFTG